MDKLDQLHQRIQAINELLNISEMDEESIDTAVENWAVEKLNNKLI